MTSRAVDRSQSLEVAGRRVGSRVGVGAGRRSVLLEQQRAVVGVVTVEVRRRDDARGTRAGILG